MGVIEAIHIAPVAGGPVHPVDEARVVAGKGIAGDRYGEQEGTFSDYPHDHEFTLIEAEEIENLARAHGVVLAPGESRRNVTTRGVRLNPLVGRRFRVGGILCEGTRLCEPCAHLERLTAKPGLSRLLGGRAGLRALVVEGGAIRVGDPVGPLEDAAGS
jgi:MOSC domain-containing protein YiiM